MSCPETGIKLFFFFFNEPAPTEISPFPHPAPLPICEGPDPPADRVAAARDGRLDAGEWRGHLRDEREPVRHAGVGPLHGQAGTAVCPHLRLAQGPAPTADRLERPTAARLHAGRREAAYDRDRLGPGRTAPHCTTQHHRVGGGA